MSIFTSRPVLRWAAPVAVFVATIAGGASAGTLAASAATTPSGPSPADLLTAIQNARNQPVSGTLVERADLGLPAMAATNGGSSNMRSLISGSHTLRIWYAGPNQSRLALIGTLGETDIIRNGRDVWVWDSQKNTVTHKTLPGRAPGAAGGSPSPTLTMPGPAQSTPSPTGTPSPTEMTSSPTEMTSSPTGAAYAQTPSPGGTESPTELPILNQIPSQGETPSPSPTAMTPQDISNRIIAKLQPSTNVTTRGPVRVAGRNANELVLVPRDTRSLVARVTLAVDAQRGVPLRAQVFARNYTPPAFETAFTQINFAQPNQAQFNFTPPPGATVKEAKPNHRQNMPHERPTVVGKGWTSVVIAKFPPEAIRGRQPAGPSATSPSTTSPSATSPSTASPPTASPTASPTAGGLSIQNLPAVSGPWGSGHLLTSRLFTVLFMDDGRVLAGAVPPALLYQAAAK
jgi:outer membrane lipoprotein-sorting protein